MKRVPREDQHRRQNRHEPEGPSTVSVGVPAVKHDTSLSIHLPPRLPQHSVTPRPEVDESPFKKAPHRNPIKARTGSLEGRSTAPRPLEQVNLSILFQGFHNWHRRADERALISGWRVGGQAQGLSECSVNHADF